MEGDTQALIYKVPKDKVISKTSKDWLESGDEIEASVRMQYVTIDLAMDSSDPDDTTEKKLFDKHIDDIANKEELEVINFFWAVSEAKNKLESSLVVFGSNSATGQLINLDKNTKAAEQALLIKQEGEAAAQALQDKRDLFL